MCVLTYKAATSDSMNSNIHDAVPCMLLLLTMLQKACQTLITSGACQKTCRFCSMPAFWSHPKRVADPVLQRTAGMLVQPGKSRTSTKKHHACSYVKRYALISKVHNPSLSWKMNAMNCQCCRCKKCIMVVLVNRRQPASITVHAWASTKQAKCVKKTFHL